MPTDDARPCPGCQASWGSPFGTVNAFDMRTCGSCGTVYVIRLTGASATADYSGYYHEGNLEVPEFVHDQLDRVVASLEERRQRNRWLDVGCGAGTLVEAARRHGWEATGTEVSESAVAALRERGLDVALGELGELDLPEAEFDVISLVEVVEHVPDPAGLLSEAARLLRPGGALYLTTPHGRGLSARLLGPRWSVVAPPEHLQLFTMAGLRQALARVGLRVVDARTSGVEPRELLSAIGRHRNRPIGGGERVASSYRLNEALSSRRVGSRLKSVVNAGLNAGGLGDSIKLTALRG